MSPHTSVHFMLGRYGYTTSQSFDHEYDKYFILISEKVYFIHYLATLVAKICGFATHHEMSVSFTSLSEINIICVPKI